MEIDDRIDNDCDGEVDEELCDDDIGLYLITILNQHLLIHIFIFAIQEIYEHSTRQR